MKTLEAEINDALKEVLNNPKYEVKKNGGHSSYTLAQLTVMELLDRGVISWEENTKHCQNVPGPEYDKVEKIITCAKIFAAQIVGV